MYNTNIQSWYVYNNILYSSENKNKEKEKKKKKDKKNKWDMYDVDVTEEEFKGRFKLNVLNKPQVVVNRFSATIVMDGFGNGFNGKCKKIDTKEKQF